ncbi:MAG: hypothetical protein JWM85_2074 [Acidimicrobiaceae bacterium]|nr:hypothetical protein [Acidimicrobiaceae bacterium]
MTDLFSSLAGDEGGSITGDLEKTLKLEQAYLLIIPPSSPAGGAMSAAIGAASIGGSEALSMTGEDKNSSIQAATSVLGGTTGAKLTFQFNPQSYSVEKSTSWDRESQPGDQETSIPQFKGSNPRSLSVDIYLDVTYSKSGSVADDVNLLFTCCKPTFMSMAMGLPSPPFCIFGWGTTMSFLSYLKSVKAEYTYFRSDGTPLRANCSITLEEIPQALPSQNPTSGGTARRVRTTVVGDTLQSVAFREYGRPTYWRAIAEANGIEDPLRLAAGTELLIPPRGEASEHS